MMVMNTQNKNFAVSHSIFPIFTDAQIVPSSASAHLFSLTPKLS